MDVTFGNQEFKNSAVLPIPRMRRKSSRETFSEVIFSSFVYQVIFCLSEFNAMYYINVKLSTSLVSPDREKEIPLSMNISVSTDNPLC
jgi:hypothetical protein